MNVLLYILKLTAYAIGIVLGVLFYTVTSAVVAQFSPFWGAFLFGFLTVLIIVFAILSLGEA